MKDLVVPAPMRIIHSANTALTFCSPTSSFGRKKEKSVTRQVHSIPNNRVDKTKDFIYAESFTSCFSHSLQISLNGMSSAEYNLVHSRADGSCQS